MYIYRINCLPNKEKLTFVYETFKILAYFSSLLYCILGIMPFTLYKKKKKKIKKLQEFMIYKITHL